VIGIVGSIREADIDAVLAFLPYFERLDNVKYNIDSASTLDPYTYSDGVREFVQTLHDRELVLAFDWPEWQHRAGLFVEKPELLEDASLDTLVRLLTTHVRKDRFDAGHLAAMIECGHILAILVRLRALRNSRVAFDSTS
jgi:hypothetical protein